MSSADSPSLELKRQPICEHTLAAIALAIAAFIPWVLPLTFTQRIVLAMAAGAVIAAGGWRAGLIGVRWRVSQALWDGDGCWWLVDAAGVRWVAQLDVGTRVVPALLWLHWRSERGVRNMVLWRGALPPACERRLIVRLRLQGHAAYEHS